MILALVGCAQTSGWRDAFPAQEAIGVEGSLRYSQALSDFGRVVNDKEPNYSQLNGPIIRDGGTRSYQGQGYIITARRTIGKRPSTIISFESTSEKSGKVTYRYDHPTHQSN